jgi:Xaa-Pro aminopeptidase/Xaa-Pro dipeptidase
MFPDMQVFQERISKVRLDLSVFHVDAILFLDMKNIRYLTGFTGSDGALFIGHEQKTLLVDGRYTHQAKREVTDISIIEYREKVDGIESVIIDSGLKTIGFEAAAMNVQTYLGLNSRTKGVTLKPVSGEISAIRTVKDETEIARMRKAAEISFKALKDVRELIKPGVMEKDIALEIEFKMGRYGADQIAFPTIVASGVNSSLPHAKPGSRRIEPGDVVMIDYGAVYQGYHSDETWTVMVGNSEHRQKEIYAVVKEAHDRALSAVKAGISCKEIDRVARSFIENKILGEYFPHGTGHGVGLDVHEAPRISTQSEHVLQKGMVVTIEPGVYIPDLWGIRIEDMILVKENGCEVLTRMPKDFTVLN